MRNGNRIASFHLHRTLFSPKLRSTSFHLHRRLSRRRLPPGPMAKKKPPKKRSLGHKPSGTGSRSSSPASSQKSLHVSKTAEIESPPFGIQSEEENRPAD